MMRSRSSGVSPPHRPSAASARPSSWNAPVVSTIAASATMVASGRPSQGVERPRTAMPTAATSTPTAGNAPAAGADRPAEPHPHRDAREELHRDGGQTHPFAGPARRGATDPDRARRRSREPPLLEGGHVGDRGAAQATIGTATSAPLPSPRRSPRSRSGAMPSRPAAAVPGLRGPVRREAVVEGARRADVQRRHRGAHDEPVEQHGDDRWRPRTTAPRIATSSAPPTCRRASRGGMPRCVGRRGHGGHLRASPASSTPVPRPVQPPPRRRRARRRRGGGRRVPDPHLAHHEQVGAVLGRAVRRPDAGRTHAGTVRGRARGRPGCHPSARRPPRRRPRSERRHRARHRRGVATRSSRALSMPSSPPTGRR